MGLPYLIAGIGIGVYIKGGTLKESAFWGGVTYAGAYVITHPIQSAKAFGTGARYAFTTSLQTMAGDAVSSYPARLVAGAALGYAIGAVVGTGVVAVAEEQGWVKEGSTADVIGFYTGGYYDAGGMEPHYWAQGEQPTPGYFNIPGNLSSIYADLDLGW